MKSMTGYGLGEAESESYQVKIEMRSVNNRYCDINLRNPVLLFPIEDKIKKAIKEKVKRGKIDVFIKLKSLNSSNYSLALDLNLARNYYEAAGEISDALNLENSLSVKDLMTMPGVVSENEEEKTTEELENLLFEVLNSALNSFIYARVREGESIKEDFKGKLKNIESILKKIESLAPQSLVENEEKLKERVSKYLDASEIERQRIATECFLIIDKLSIDEEITRLKIHLKSFWDLIEEEGSLGRKMDFLIQEMNREVNTIGSKANNINIINDVVAIKAEIERIREQAQNIE
ncbi:YicC/YloC family endoribonuclease [Peptoniphilus raoultii]|uniref:YicC/YloC family endoribonuclease n=1 Tax=Peptoniphilus raoultii TaxID=1776387 RepID=UPI0008D903CA|nr:YicC/YloC family endoribonuclease [Peptoniphilus raoultii]